MNKSLTIISIAFFMTCGSASSAQDQADTMLADLAIPLMEGLRENGDAAMLFDSPGGRIINVEAKGVVAASEVYQYYQAVLPSLGWVVSESIASGMICEGTADYCLMAIREDENLTLNIDMSGSTSKITYAISPN